MNYSLIINFFHDKTIQLIENFKKEIISIHGGDTILDLPVHITLIKFSSNNKLSLKLLIDSNIDSPEFITLSAAILDSEKPWIYFKPDSELWLKSLQKRLSDFMEDFDEVDLINNLHVTLAYRDYTQNTIKLIYENWMNSLKNDELILKPYSIALCNRPLLGDWAITEEIPFSVLRNYI